MKFLKQLFCAMRGHMGIATVDGSGHFFFGQRCRCKVCGKEFVL